MKPIDMPIGARFGSLVLTGGYEMRHGCRTWAVVCDCGTRKFVNGVALRKGSTTTCGPRHFKHRLTHGLSGTRIYHIWSAMRGRCKNSSARDAKYYALKGIRVCDRWASSFDAFLEDMGPLPSPRHTIDRIDPNGNYEPGNCRWATPREQCLNQERTRRVVLHGESVPLVVACERVGLPYSAVIQRLCRLGWSDERALTQPLREMRRA